MPKGRNSAQRFAAPQTTGTPVPPYDVARWNTLRVDEDYVCKLVASVCSINFLGWQIQTIILFDMKIENRIWFKYLSRLRPTLINDTTGFFSFAMPVFIFPQINLVFGDRFKYVPMFCYTPNTIYKVYLSFYANHKTRQSLFHRPQAEKTIHRKNFVRQVPANT